MRIRLGYVGVSKTIDVTSSTNLTYTEFLKNKDIAKIDRVIISNLEALKEILIYNIKNDILFFRLTSKLIPLATKTEVEFDYIDKYINFYNDLKNYCKKLRIDVHPDQFTVLNSTKKEVVLNSIEILKYHYNILKALGIKEKVIILHIGSSVFGKESSIKRFIHNFNKLPDYLKECIVIENDDKVYNVIDCLNLNKKINAPIVLDYHHYLCNNDGEDIDDYFEKIFDTWKHINPKVHFSSPKSKLKKEFRAHHEYINVFEFIKFIEKIKHLDYDIDVMIEAKAKDEALFKLIRQLKYYTDYKIKGTTIYL